MHVKEPRGGAPHVRTLLEALSALKGPLLGMSAPLEGTFYHNGGMSRLFDGNCFLNP